MICVSLIRKCLSCFDWLKMLNADHLYPLATSGKAVKKSGGMSGTRRLPPSYLSSFSQKSQLIEPRRDAVVDEDDCLWQTLRSIFMTKDQRA